MTRKRLFRAALAAMCFLALRMAPSGDVAAAGRPDTFWVSPPVDVTWVARPAERRNSPVGLPVFYVAYDLNALSQHEVVSAAAISARGMVAGRAYDERRFEQAFVYDRFGLRLLGTLGGHFSQANGMSPSGRIAGYSLTGETDELGFVPAAFVFTRNDRRLRDLGIRWSSASAINDAGQVVGTMLVPTGSQHAFLYENGTATDLGTLGGPNSSARSLNRAGQVVGESDTFVQGMADPARRFAATRAFRYESGTMTDLGSLGAYCVVFDDEAGPVEECVEHSSATDINSTGAIVGYSSTPEGSPAHAFLLTGGRMRDLGTLGGAQSWAYALNDSGQVVGASLTPPDDALRPFLYDRGTMYDLRSLVAREGALQMTTALDINNYGQIVGDHYLLNPVYARMTAGPGLSFTDRLGRALRFAYWVGAGSRSACDARRARLRVEVKIEGAGIRRGWEPAGPLLPACAHSADWHDARIGVAPRDRGMLATIRLRVREVGSAGRPTVYLRHFAME